MSSCSCNERPCEPCQKVMKFLDYAKGGNIEKLQKALTQGVDINSKDKWNEEGPAISAAIYSRKPEMVHYLISAGADLNCADFHGRTPLMAACIVGNNEIIEALLNGGADVNIVDKNDFTAINYLTSSRDVNVDVCKLLILAGADVNWKVCGSTPLMNALRFGNKELCTTLISAGAELEHMNMFNQTELMVAAMKGNKEICEVLIAADANLHAFDKNGDCAFTLAQEGHHLDVCELLAAAGASTESCAVSAPLFDLSDEDVLKDKFVCVTVPLSKVTGEYSCGCGYALMVNEELTHGTVRYYEYSMCESTLSVLHKSPVVYSGPLDTIIAVMNDRMNLANHDEALDRHSYDYESVLKFYKIALTWNNDGRLKKRYCENSHDGSIMALKWANCIDPEHRAKLQNIF